MQKFPQSQKKNQKQMLTQAMILGTNKMTTEGKINFLVGYIACDIGVLPNQQNIAILINIIKGLQQYVENQIISNTNLIQIFVQAAECTINVKNNIAKDQIMNKLQNNINQIVGQVSQNRQFIRQKWAKQKKSQSYSEILEMNQKQQKKKEIKSKKEQEQQQTLKLIKKLQEDDERQQQARRLRQKEQQAKLNQFLKQDKLKQEKQKNKIKQSSQKILNCQVCAEDISYNDIGVLACGHIFHRSCIEIHIQTLLNEKKVNVPCPSNCGKIMSTDDINEFINPKLKEKYDRFSFDIYIEQNQKQISWCPTAGCTAVFGYEKDLDNYNCPICMRHYCLNCRCEYHVKMTCEEYKIKSKDDKQFEKFAIGLKFKQCPRCRFWVQRTKGCNSMTCRCGNKFCYDCGGPDCPHGACKKKLGGLPLIPPQL